MFKIIQYNNTIDFDAKLEKQIQSYYYHFSDEFADKVRSIPVFLLNEKEFLRHHPFAKLRRMESDNSYREEPNGKSLGISQPSTELLGYYASGGKPYFKNKAVIAINFDMICKIYNNHIKELFLKVLIHEYAHVVYDVKIIKPNTIKKKMLFLLEECMANALAISYIRGSNKLSNQPKIESHKVTWIEGFIQLQPDGYNQGVFAADMFGEDIKLAIQAYKNEKKCYFKHLLEENKDNCTSLFLNNHISRNNSIVPYLKLMMCKNSDRNNKYLLSEADKLKLETIDKLVFKVCTSKSNHIW